MSDKQIQDWQEKVRTQFNDESKLYEYLFTTMDNFYYRYLETTRDKNLTTKELRPGVWGARSFEPSMVDALKIKNPLARKGIIELAKTLPRGEGGQVYYELSAQIKELNSEKGEIILNSLISWDFPHFKDETREFRKSFVFKYNDLTQFRKELALKLEEVCEGFL